VTCWLLTASLSDGCAASSEHVVIRAVVPVALEQTAHTERALKSFAGPPWGKRHMRAALLRFLWIF